jgi:phosphoribosylformylglycinamidine synthase
MKSAVIVFPASNCDRDAFETLHKFAGGQQADPALSYASWRAQEARAGGNVIKVWHRDSELPKVDLVVLPGGFSYGDYLRSGAMAAHSPIMQEVKKHAARGGLVLGVCNGFQVLTEAGLLPGVLMRNAKLKFLCREVFLRVGNNATAFTKRYTAGQVINVPIAHHDGNYFADSDTLKSLEDHNQIAFSYCDEKGGITAEANPNGSQLNIAGIVNKQGNVLGMMPHPERHAEALLGGADGAAMFEGLAA